LGGSGIAISENPFERNRPATIAEDVPALDYFPATAELARIDRVNR
jgi:hypothetical protein